MLREVLTEMNVPFVEAVNEAAFYGPKVDVQFKSVIGREETMSTIQLDFAAKGRFGLSYVDETGKENSEEPSIAPLSTHERFAAFPIEHYAGVYQPGAVRSIGAVSAKHAEGAAAGRRIPRCRDPRDVDDADETVGNKIRKAAIQNPTLSW